MKAFLSSTLGKVIIGVLAVAVVAGGGYGVYRAVQPEGVPTAETTSEPTIDEATTTEAPATTTAAETTTKPVTTASEPTTTAKPAKPDPVKMTGTNTSPALIEKFTAHPEAIFEWNNNGYWEYKSSSATDPKWSGNISADQWTVPAGYEYRTSMDWRDPSVKPYIVTGTFGPFGIGPGDRIYKIDPTVITTTAKPTTTAKATMYKPSGVVELSPIMYEPHWQLAKRLGFWVMEPDIGETWFSHPDGSTSLYTRVRDGAMIYEIDIATPTISFYGLKIGDPLDITKIPARLYDDIQQYGNNYLLTKGDYDKYNFGADENGIITRMVLRYKLP